MILCLDKGHKSTKNIALKKAFSLSFATVDSVASSDYVGLVSGNSVDDKIEKAGWSTLRSRFVDAPIINELPIALECELIRIDAEEHVIGRIVNVSVDDAVLSEDGKPDYRKIRPITYDPVHFDYVALGEKVGDAFKEGRKLMK